MAVTRKITMPQPSSTARARSLFFHHGRSSFTSYAVLSASSNVVKILEPDHAASTAPIEISPGAFDAKTTSLTTLERREKASLGTTVDKRARRSDTSFRLSPSRLSIGA